MSGFGPVAPITSNVEKACLYLNEIAEQVEGMNSSEIVEFREADPLFDGLKKVKQAVQMIESQLTQRFCELNEEVVYEGNVFYAGLTKSAEKWDGEGLASLCAARGTDLYYDRETGEAVAPVVLATELVTRTVKCLGGFAASTSWRVTALASEFGIDKATVARFRSSEPGWPKIGSRPVQAKDVAA